MQIRFAPPQLQALDREHGGTLVLSAHAEDRPLRGLAGRVDWRLCGRLSQLLVEEELDADFGAALLTPIAGRLPFDRLMFVGLGPRAEYDAARYAEACHIIAWKLARMGERHFAMALPGTIGRGLGLREAVWGWRQGIIRSFDSAGLSQLEICVLAERSAALELRQPLLSVAEEVNEALARKTTQAALAKAPPRQRPGAAEEPNAQQVPESPQRSPSRRGWQTGVMKIGPASAETARRPQITGPIDQVE